MINAVPARASLCLFRRQERGLEVAELTNLEAKLGEVVGLAMAAQAATKKVATLARADKRSGLVATLEKMNAEAREAEERGQAVAITFEGKKSAILSEAREAKEERRRDDEHVSRRRLGLARRARVSDDGRGR